LTFTNASRGARQRVDEAVAEELTGKIAIKAAFITAFGERKSRPIVIKTQERANATTITGARAASVPGTPALGR
jgi:hypothetical protein